ncbi:pentapeptide repeat-containing protein [Bradyrhizobium sp.]
MYIFGVLACIILARKTFMPSWNEISDIEAAKVFFPMLVAVIGGPLLIWRVVTAHIQAAAARQQASIAMDGLYTEVFAKAVDQLGTTREVRRTQQKFTEVQDTLNEAEANLEVRLGAIYSLERIARDSERDHWTVIEVLCAYIRNPQNCGKPLIRPAGASPGSEDFKRWISSIHPPRMDVSAALTVIGRRSPDRIAYERKRKLRLDLSSANLQGANLSRGDFSDADMSDVHLERASCSGTNFHQTGFHDARLESAHMHNCNLQEAFLIRANLDGAELTCAKLRGAHLDKAQLNKADLSGANLKQARLSWAQLDEATVWYDAGMGGLLAEFDGVDLTGARLFGIDFSVYENYGDLSNKSIWDAFGDASTVTPKKFKRPTSWPDQQLSVQARDDWYQKEYLQRDGRRYQNWEHYEDEFGLD